MPFDCSGGRWHWAGNSFLARYVRTMPSKPVAFKMSEVMRTVRGAEAAGKKVSTVEVDPATGIIRLAFHDGGRKRLKFKGHARSRFNAATAADVPAQAYRSR
jgi:hypothetical protein